MNKIIHYCWFGGNPLPEKAQKCIASWKSFFPDYEIKQWNEGNFDFSECLYAVEAYQSKKWAFVSDYARFKILSQYGGLYFDTDVEVVSSFEDIIQNGSFLGCENKEIAPGLCIGLDDDSSAHAIIDELIDFYQTIHFINDDGSLNQKTVCEYTTNIFKKYGFLENGLLQGVSGFTIYPKNYFNPLDPVTGELMITSETKSIHWFSASWYGEKEKYISQKAKKYSSILPHRLAHKLAVLIGMIKYDGIKKTCSKLRHRS